MPKGGTIKFTHEVRLKYLQSLREGNLKNESARIAGVSYKTVCRHRKDDDGFREDEAFAMDEALEGIEKILYEMALERDLGAIDRWLRAHKKSTYGTQATVTIDATDNAVEMSAMQALAKVSELQQTLEERRGRLLESGDIIDAESEELQIETHLLAPPDEEPTKFVI